MTKLWHFQISMEIQELLEAFLADRRQAEEYWLEISCLGQDLKIFFND